jgi:hypothetical protein
MSAHSSMPYHGGSPTPGGMSLRELERKVTAEVVQDGYLEIVVGMLLYLGGLVVADLRNIVFYVVFLIPVSRAVEVARERYTYPRLGQVVLRRAKPKPLLAGVALVVLGALGVLIPVLTLLGGLSTAALSRWLPVAAGLCVLGFFLYWRARSGLARFLLYGVLALAAGLVVGSIHLPSPKDNLAVYLIGAGAALGLAGLAMNIRFRHTHPVLPEELDNGGG